MHTTSVTVACHILKLICSQYTSQSTAFSDTTVLTYTCTCLYCLLAAWLLRTTIYLISYHVSSNVETAWWQCIHVLICYHVWQTSNTTNIVHLLFQHNVRTLCSSHTYILVDSQCLEIAPNYIEINQCHDQVGSLWLFAELANLANLQQNGIFNYM